jgi:hypothetical protein
MELTATQTMEQIVSLIIFLNVINKMDLIAQQVTGFA